VGSSTSQMMTQLNKGPVFVSMSVYADFMAYVGGVYKHVTGSKLGGHAIHIVGYDQNEKYWIVKNSWSESWGEKGFFRISWDDTDSGIGSAGRYAFTVPKYNGYVTIQEPEHLDLISGVKEFKVVNTFAGISKVGIKIGTTDYDGLVNQIDTEKLPDGTYQARAYADNEYSDGIIFYILNGALDPNWNISVDTQNGATLKSKVYMTFICNVGVVPFTKMTLDIMGAKNKSVNLMSPCPKVKVGWDTTGFPNGSYTVGGTAYFGDKYTVKLKDISVTIQN